VQRDDRWVAHLTDAGRALVDTLPADENPG
jgi:hypothetical protein